MSLYTPPRRHPPSSSPEGYGHHRDWTDQPPPGTARATATTRATGEGGLHANPALHRRGSRTAAEHHTQVHPPTHCRTPHRVHPPGPTHPHRRPGIGGVRRGRSRRSRRPRIGAGMSEPVTLYSSQQIAYLLGVGLDRVRRRTQNRTLPHVRVGRKVWFTEAHVCSIVRQLTLEPVSREHAGSGERALPALTLRPNRPTQARPGGDPSPWPGPHRTGCRSALASTRRARWRPSRAATRGPSRRPSHRPGRSTVRRTGRR